MGWVEGVGTFTGRDMSREMKTLAFILQVVGNLDTFVLFCF